MANIGFETLRAEISRAHQFAKGQQFRLAAQSFAVLRAMIVDRADPAVLRQAGAAERVPMREARQALRAAVGGRGDAARPLLILTDAAALPGHDVSVEDTFSWRLGGMPYSHRVDCIGQQDFLSADVLALLTNAPNLGRGADVVVMIGQADCAQPLLLGPERLALGMLPDDLRNPLHDFVIRFGGTIAGLLPIRPVTPVGTFGANFDGILRALRVRNARRIVVVTVLSSGDCMAHNAEVLLAARAADAIVIDFDRVARPAIGGLTDQGRWSATLHRLFAETLAGALPREVAIPAAMADATGVAMQ